MALVFELFGSNLEDFFRYCGNQFSLKTTLMLADQLLRRIEVLHSKNYLHRDIKPENFLLGLQQQGITVYMTDLGLAKYRHPERWDIKSPPVRAATTRLPQLVAPVSETFEKYMKYVHKLHDEDLPDYQGLRKWFDKSFREQGFERDNVFDWTIREFERLEPGRPRTACVERWGRATGRGRYRAIR